MQSFGWIVQPYPQMGPPSQSSQAPTQLTQDTMRNQQAGTANNIYQYKTENHHRPPQSVLFTVGNGASNRQTSNGQTSAVPHQAVFFQQPTGGKNNCYQTVLHGNLQHSSPNMQSGNPHSQVVYKIHNTTPQDFHQNSAQNSSTQNRSDMMKANITYIQRDMSANWNQSVTLTGNENGNNVSALLHRSVQRNLSQYVNGESTNPISALSTTATSLPPAQAVCNRTLGSATAHNIQTAPHQHRRKNSTQHGFPPSIPLPTYNKTVSQSHRNSSITTNSPSSGWSLHFPDMSPKTQRYSTQLNSTPNNWRASTSSINTNSYNNCQYEISKFLSKTKELPLNPTADTQQQMLSRQMSPRFADNLSETFTAGSGVRPPMYTSSPHNGKQFNSRGKMIESNPTIAPVPSSVIGHYNSNVSQSLPLHSGHSLPKFTQNLISPTRHVVDELPQHVQQPKIISPQRNKSHSSVAKNSEYLEILEMLTSINPNDSSIHSSPGRTGPKAIAVVQPLAQECYQVSSKDMSSKRISQECERITTDKSQNNPEKLLISPDVSTNKMAPYLRELSNPLKDDCRFPHKNPNHVRSNKSATGHQAASKNGPGVLSSNSTRPQQSQKQLCADNTGSELTNNMQLDQVVAPAAQQPLTSEVPESQNGDKDKSEMPPDAKTCVCELSSLPTTPWTIVPILKAIQEGEEAQMKSELFPEFNTSRMLLSMYWDGSCKKLADKLRTGWYKEMITDVHEYRSEYLTLDSVILSQVKHSFKKHLKNFHVMADNEVYSELPYVSSWLNTNEQLDNIDKEFGFPWSLKHFPHTIDSDSQSDQLDPDKSIPTQIEGELQDEALSQKELEPVESDDEKHSTVEVASTQTASPKTESADSSDPFFSFDIKVLPPEEAKVIFEQLQSNTPQNTETVCQLEKATNSPVEEELPEVIDLTRSDSKLEIQVLPPEEAKVIFEQVQRNEPHTETVCQLEKVTNSPKLENRAVTPLEHICCDKNWKQIIMGSNTPSSSTCQCKTEQSHEECTDITVDDKERAAQKNDKLFATRPDSKSMRENQAKGFENIINQIHTLTEPELCCEVSQVIDLSDSDDKPASYSDKDLNNISLISINSSPSSIIFINKSTDENLFSSEDEIPNPMSDLEENCGQAQLTSPDMSPLKTKGQINATAAPQTFSCKHETVDPGSQQLFEGISKCKKVSVDAAVREPSASNVRTVELVLFGSASQEKCALVGGHKNHRSFSQTVSEVPKPPEVLSVSLSPVKRKPGGTDPTGEYSVKRRIHEKWRKSFPPIRIKFRNKLKTQKRTLSEVSHKKAERSGSYTEELPASSETRIWNGNNKRTLSLKRRRSLSYGFKLGEKKTKKDEVTLKQPAVHERSKVDSGSQAVVPLQENIVLRFSVLPNTFSFKDSSNGIKDTTNDVSDKSDIVEADDESPSAPVKRARGAWYPNPERQYTPLRPSPIPKTSSIFHEYQKKYTKKMQPSSDK